MGRDEALLFVTSRGERLTPDGLTTIVGRYVEAGVGRRGACHLFRHTCATLMLEGGADIRYIQQQLGHARLETTEIYTRVSIGTLKAIHTATHPGAQLRPVEGDDDEEEEVATSEGEGGEA